MTIVSISADTDGLAPGTGSQPVPGSAAVAAATERNLLARRTDWRFLLPSPPGGTFERLVLLGGPVGLRQQVEALGIAQHVCTCLPDDQSADAVIRLHDGRGRVPVVTKCLRPGGVLYYEVDRHRRADRQLGLADLRQQLRAAGLTPTGAFWVRDDFRSHRVYLPADLPAAAAWYFARLQESRSRREQLAVACYRIAAALGSGAIARVMRCYAVTASFGEPLSISPSVLSAPDLPGELRERSLQPIVIAPRLQRVIFLPFANGAREPAAVVKVSRFPLRNQETVNEQAALAAVRADLAPPLRDTIPEPLGAVAWGRLTVGVERCIQGRLLIHPRGLPPAGTAHRLDDLRAVSAWLAELHGHVGIVRRTWDETAIARLDADLAEYAQAFGATAPERDLFRRASLHARALLGSTVPVVWRHGDLTLRNAFRTPHGIGVIDWEYATPGLPLLDLLHFAEDWLYSAPGAEGLRAKVARFRSVFIQGPTATPLGRVVHAAVDGYVRRIGLDPRFTPLLHVALRVERALRRRRRANDPDTDRIGRELEDRCVQYVRALADGAERLFPEVGPAEEHEAVVVGVEELPK